MSGERIKKEELMDTDEYELPPRDAGTSYRGAAENTVLANLFSISVDTSRTIFKYRLDVRKVIASKDKEVDLTKGPKNDFATQARRRVLQSLFIDLTKYAEKQGQPIMNDKYGAIYDCGNIIYATHVLPCLEGKGDSEHLVKLPIEAVSSENSKRFLGTACTEVLMTISPTIQFNFCLNGDLGRESQQFMEVLTSARLVKDGDHFVFKNKFYGKSSRSEIPLDEGKAIKPGFEKNCRVGERNGRAIALLQLDAKKSPFFVGSKVTEFCTNFLKMRDTRDLENMKPNDIRALSAQLKGLVVRTTHTEKNKTRTFAITSVSSQCAKDISFEHDGNTITMDEYFKSRYNTSIKYSRIPVISERTPRGVSYYPMEFLEIERGQRVNCQKATPNMAEKQIKECRMEPIQMRDYVENAFKECRLDSDNPFLKAFDVRVESEWQRANATVLHPPKIVYQDSSVECGRDGFMNWKMGREHFIRGGQITKFCFIVLDDCVRDDGVDHFLRSLLGSAQKFGIDVSDRDVVVEHLRSESESKIEKLFEDLKREKYPYVMAITRQKMDPAHDMLKALEARTGVVTQHVSSPTFMKAIGQKGAFMVINNLVLKMNLKSRGINHALELAWPFVEANKGANVGDINKRLMPKYRMFIGLDISHAGPQSFADRQLGSNSSEPSVVGMSYSISTVTEMKGLYWLQEPRLAAISELESYTAKALNDFCDKMGRLPEDIVVYRGGVSEGEYSKIVEEIKDIKKAFRLVKGGDTFAPSIQCIVVQTNSNFRIIPERVSGGRDQNVPPGTCIDSGITNPMWNEFVLVGQKGIMGTVRPIKCVVAHNEQGKTGALPNLNDLKLLTNMLCYGHQVVAGSTTLPCLLTAATNLSKRGRNNWKTINFRNAEARSEVSGGSGGAYRHDGSKDFFTNLSSTIKSKNNHHYWA